MLRVIASRGDFGLPSFYEGRGLACNIGEGAFGYSAETDQLLRCDLRSLDVSRSASVIVSGRPILKPVCEEHDIIHTQGRYADLLIIVLDESHCFGLQGLVHHRANRSNPQFACEISFLDFNAGGLDAFGRARNILSDRAHRPRERQAAHYLDFDVLALMSVGVLSLLVHLSDCEESSGSSDPAAKCGEPFSNAWISGFADRACVNGWAQPQQDYGRRKHQSDNRDAVFHPPFNHGPPPTIAVSVACASPSPQWDLCARAGMAATPTIFQTLTGQEGAS